MAHQIRLSVPRYFDEAEMDKNNNLMIHKGSFGRSGLDSEVYDNRYTLHLSTCCKHESMP
jgi:hypothetical protein